MARSDEVEALEIAIRLMDRHLAYMTPGGAGQDSNAYRIAAGRISTLRALRDRLQKEPNDGNQEDDTHAGEN